MEQKVNGILTYIQTIFADNSYSKPYFVTYINTTFFIIPLIPMFIHHLWLDRSNTIYQKPLLAQLSDLLSRRAGKISLLRDHEATACTHPKSLKKKTKA
jgi:solute carrier family 35 protein F5